MSEQSPAARVAVIGLGSMGAGIARALVRAGLETYGFDVNAKAVDAFVADGGATGKLADLASTLDVVVVVVVNAEQVETVLFGADGVVSKLVPGAAVVGCATVAPAFARQMGSRCALAGVHYLDGPISGGSVKAAAGELSVMASGTAAAFAVSEPVLDAMAQTVFRLGGEPGAGSAMKVVNQMLAGVHIAAAAEAITFGMTQGVAPADCVSVISKCAGTSWMFENRGPHIAHGDYTPRSAVEIFVKDLGIVTDIARAARFAAPLSAAALQQFLAAAGMGHGGEDDAAVAKVYARNAGIELPRGPAQ